MNRKHRQMPVTRAQVDAAFRAMGFAEARECDVQVIKMLGGTMEQLEAMITDHWKITDRRTVKRAMTAAMQAGAKENGR